MPKVNDRNSDFFLKFFGSCDIFMHGCRFLHFYLYLILCRKPLQKVQFSIHIFIFSIYKKFNFIGYCSHKKTSYLPYFISDNLYRLSSGILRISRISLLSEYYFNTFIHEDDLYWWNIKCKKLHYEQMAGIIIFSITFIYTVKRISTIKCG